MRLHEILKKDFKTIRRKEWTDDLEIYPNGLFNGFLTNEFKPVEFQISQKDILSNDWEPGKGVVDIHSYNDCVSHIYGNLLSYYNLFKNNGKSEYEIYCKLVEVLVDSAREIGIEITETKYIEGMNKSNSFGIF